MNEEVSNYIDTAAEKHRELLQELRATILSMGSDVKEQFKWSRPVYALEKDFCYLKTTKKHVSLGFFDFKKISTNQHLIEGTGASMRHIKLNETKEIEDLQIKQMLEEVLK